MPGDLEGAICVADLGDTKRTLSMSLVLSMVEIGDQAFARRNPRPVQPRALPPTAYRRQVYEYHIRQTPFMPPLTMPREPPAWRPFDSLTSNLDQVSLHAPVQANPMSRHKISDWEADIMFPAWVAQVSRREGTVVDDLTLMSTDTWRQGKMLEVVTDQQGSTSLWVQYFLDKEPNPAALGLHGGV